MMPVKRGCHTNGLGRYDMAMARFAAKFLILLALVVFALTAWPQKVEGEPQAGGATSRLVKVQETRRARLVSQDENSYEFHKPGLELTFEVTLPGGGQLIDIEQPEKIVATDSTGHDLTDIEKNFMGKRQYVTFLRKMDGESKEFTIQLAPPTRQATHFNVSTTFDVWAYHELTESTVAVRTKPVTLDAVLFGGTNVTAMLQSRGDHTQLVLTPGTVKQFVERVTLSDGTRDYDNNGAMWNNVMLSYDFDTKATDAMTAKLSIRSGMSKMPCTVSLKNQPLP